MGGNDYGEDPWNGDRDGPTDMYNLLLLTASCTLPQTVGVISMSLPSVGTWTSVGYPVAPCALWMYKCIAREGVKASCSPHTVLRAWNGRW